MNRQFIIAVIIILLVWASLAAYYIHYGEKVNKHPCAVCAYMLKEKEMKCLGEGGQAVTIKADGNVIINKPLADLAKR